MSTSFKTLLKVFDAVSAYDSHHINSLQNSNGKKITIPVMLLSEQTPLSEEKSISGTVSMLPSGDNLMGTAVYWFDRALRDNFIYFGWHRAYVGLSKAKVEPGTYLARDRMAHAMMGYDRSKNLRDNLHEVLKNYEQRKNGGIPPVVAEQYFDLAASIIADSVVVQSEDIERIIFHTDGGLKKLFGFRPKGLEF